MHFPHRLSTWSLWLVALFQLCFAYRFDPAYTEHNTNQNKTAIDPLDYWGEWSGHSFTPSPANWRVPFYTLFLDRFVNGNPTNDNSNGTAFEHDPNSNQLRHGGDVEGLVDTLDYLQGMGVKALYIAGSPFINQPWGYDQYSPLDLTILDPHLGDIAAWREAVDEIHKHGMHVILDNTFATLGDLLGFQGHLNSSTPFTLDEHKVQWKNPGRHYYDFNFGNTYNETCDYPRFWNETGFPVDEYVTDQMNGCYDSEFDQYGDTEAFGVYPDWRRELSKFASVQDRLRDWHPPVRAKIDHFYCMLIAQLDIDGYRYDKATQATVDAIGYTNDAMRTCAKKLGKDNFFLPGEITGGNDFGAIFLGRGRQPDQVPDNATHAISMTTNNSDSKYFIREPRYSGLDAAAFHYTTYRAMTRFLGMDGSLQAGYDAPNNFVDQWNTFLVSNDMINANTGVFDPRHMYGITNQDVFRWPAIRQGTQRQLLGHFIQSLLMPGIPKLLWGEEQEFYILDNTASNYIFGRQAFSAATAWQTHGCYKLGSTNYFEMPLEAAKYGCEDEMVSYDHRDPSARVRNIIRHMLKLREVYPVLHDGAFLQQLSNMTEDVFYPGSSGLATETGMWSVVRMAFEGVQDFSDQDNGDLPVWLVYSNMNRTHKYEFDCKNDDPGRQLTALIAPYDSGTTVKNLFYPFDEHTLEDSVTILGIDGSTNANGCLGSLDMVAYDFRAYVPKESWVSPGPMITKFSPGHDARILSTVDADGTESVDVKIHFSTAMDCDGITDSITFNSTTQTSETPSIDRNSVQCGSADDVANSTLVGAVQSTWAWSATVNNVANGVHDLTVRNVSDTEGRSTDSIDHFLFRVGQANNPVVFPRSANYSSTLLSQSKDGTLSLHHSAPGADLYRYSTNFKSSFSDWMPYEGGSHEIKKQDWSGTDLQKWKGEHVRVEYYNKLSGSADYIQESDVGSKARRFPHLWLNGPYNAYGYDAGLNNKVKQVGDYEWSHHWMVEWSPNGSYAQLNVWGINPDNQPDLTTVMGDADGDSVLDRLPPSSLSDVVLNITAPPPKPYLSWTFKINDGSLRFRLVPTGSMWTQLALYILLWLVPLLTASFSVWLYMKSFYGVKFNEIGIAPTASWIPAVFTKRFQRLPDEEADEEKSEHHGVLGMFKHKPEKTIQPHDAIDRSTDSRRTVLIATMEYDIEDWAIKIKIGGLGVMAQLMGKNLGHQDLIWVVPCVGGIDYPIDEQAEPMRVRIMDVDYTVNVQYHKLRNITYVLLDAPVFRQQTKSEPYPARMDDMTSAVYYSAWNQCIAHAIQRFPVDLYHINDYHGTIAPLYMLPKTIPAALSLHNAEFQGLWPMRTKKERKEVCSVYNLPWEVVQEYVMYGEIFNLLHAGASYLRVHQQGFGAVGVSKKYGKRSYARYPILWGLKKVQALPNPDPSDTGEWDKKLPKESDIHVDPQYEKDRLDTREEAQEWAGLEKNRNAELFVFVGRWSMQKGVDLIADTFPAILEANPNVQLITIGPVIDLYGKFAALKLDRLMKMYPKRVCSKPVFTALPPCIFSGAEFALIPSRDEPFGLVAVEFGRKGALGVGARVGGLGQMPGWWFTVESTTTSHLLKQFKMSIKEAMSSSTETRAMMRARSAKQRFPVAQWVEDLEILQTTSMRIHDEVESKREVEHGVRNDNTPLVGLGIETPKTQAAHSRASSYGGTHLFPNPQTSHTPPLPTITGGSPFGSSTDLRRMAKERAAGLAGKGDLGSPLGSSSSLNRLQKGNTSGLSRKPSLGSRQGPGHVHPSDVADGKAEGGLSSGENFLPTIPDVDEAGLARSMGHHVDYESDVDDGHSLYYSDGDDSPPMTMPAPGRLRARRNHDSLTLGEAEPQWPLSPQTIGTGSVPQTPTMADLVPPPRIFSAEAQSPDQAMLSVDKVVGEKKDFKLQQVDPFFTDSSGVFYNAFEKKLETLDGKNSETTNCIEEYLVKSEKTWFNNFRNARLGRFHNGGLASGRSSRRSSFQHTPAVGPGTDIDGFEMDSDTHSDANSLADEFLLGKDYKPPTGIRKYMQIRIGDWPAYAYVVAMGQIMAANSYQITLLSGEVGQTASKLYTIATVYLVTSIMWWMLFRRFASRVSLSIPFFFYGLAFILIGLTPYASANGRTWINNMGAAFYALASSSGALFFALNFGDEGGAQIKAWVFRACVIQGTQQIYVVALWFWGEALTSRNSEGLTTTNYGVIGTWKITAITFPIAIFVWTAGTLLWLGLPDYYRQSPGKMPSFYKSAMKRKVVIWFFVTAIIQNFFLAAPYGRNWSFLFSSDHAKDWQVMLLVILFFIGVWAGVLAIFGHLSKSHSWILPLFAIGLGAPRWAQIWWGTSGIGLYLPWVGAWNQSYVSSALVSRSLWLWLGVLDAIQGVGLGMIMLGTLTRVHVAFAVIAQQVLGSLATMVGRAVGPNRLGPGPISPDISAGVGTIWNTWFWVGLIANLAICVGFYKFYRKEQLQKP